VSDGKKLQICSSNFAALHDTTSRVSRRCLTTPQCRVMSCRTWKKNPVWSKYPFCCTQVKPIA
jgi:hypothetical protein